ncbi:MAG TPA: hypothetical protein EYQ31_08480 [Candidatus Handelsmanbacteria bacterium]|nr:hypothetical protein [Candidatus Handelsmanbacteria bacterium]
MPRRVLACVKQLFHDNYDGKREVRLLGIALSGLEKGTGQLELPFDERSRPNIALAIDVIAWDWSSDQGATVRSFASHPVEAMALGAGCQVDQKPEGDGGELAEDET